MAWKCKYFESGSSSEDVIARMCNELNSLDEHESTTAKVAHLDARRGNAQGVVLYNEKTQVETLPALPAGPWKVLSYQLKHTYKDLKGHMNFDSVCKALDGLSSEQAAYAIFSMSDWKGGAFHAALWYPDSAGSASENT
jgi:hypothetical protein